MTPNLRSFAVAAVLALGSAGVQAGSLVEVSFLQPDKYIDFGRTARETESLQRELARAIERLARPHLGADQTLTIEVLDVDRAGRLRPLGRSAQLFRVVASPLDWPRIKLRFELRSGQGTLAQGEEWVQDLAFQHRLGFDLGNPLSAETLMLRHWFAQRLAGSPPG